MAVKDALNSIYEACLIALTPKKLLPSVLSIFPFLVLLLFVQYMQVNFGRTAGVLEAYEEVSGEALAEMGLFLLPFLISFVLVWLFLRCVYTELVIQDLRKTPSSLVAALTEAVPNTLLLAYSYFVPLLAWLVSGAVVIYLAFLSKNIVIAGLVAVFFALFIGLLFLVAFFLPVTVAEGRIGWPAFKESYRLFRLHWPETFLVYAFTGVLTTAFLRTSGLIWEVPVGTLIFCAITILITALTNPLPALLYGRLVRS